MIISLWGAPPLVNSQSYRVAKIAKYLRKRGHEIIILTQGLRSKDVIDQDLLDDINRYGNIRIIALKRSMIPRKDAIIKLLNFLCIPDNLFFLIIMNLNKICKLIQNNKIDVIIISNTPSAYLLAYLLKDRIAVKIIIDFADAWVGNPSFRPITGYHKRIFANLEKAAVSRSSALTYVSKNMGLEYELKYPSLPKLYLPNGYDPEDFNINIQNMNRNYLTFLHFGTIYRDVNVTFAEAFAKLISQRPDLYDIARLKIIGRIAKNRLAELNYLKKFANIEIIPPITHSHLIKEILSSDYLIFSRLGKLSSYDTLASRLAECLGSGKPVIACCAKGSEMERICRKCGCWKVITGDNLSEMIDAYEEAIALWRSNVKVVSNQLNSNELKEFQWDIIIEKVDQFLKELLQ